MAVEQRAGMGEGIDALLFQERVSGGAIVDVSVVIRALAYCVHCTPCALRHGGTQMLLPMRSMLEVTEVSPAVGSLCVYLPCVSDSSSPCLFAMRSPVPI